MLAHRVPYPPDKGDRIRSYHLLAQLAEVAEVDLAYLADEPVPPESEAALASLCRRVACASVSKTWRWARAARSLASGRSLTEGLFASASLRETVDGWLADAPYDAIVCFSSGVLPFVLGRGRDGRLVVDLVDVDSQKFFDYAGHERGLKAALLRLEGRRVRALEREAGRALAVVLVTEAEAAIYRSICPEARVEVIPIGVDLDYFRPMDDVVEAPETCVFVGQLDYKANVLGLEWFCREAWPAALERAPGARFRVVGRNPVRAVERLGALPGVDLIGPVADVRPHLAGAAVAVVPLPVARGIQNKVLEGMAMGRAVLASPSALEGLALVEGRDALVADTPADWANRLAALWDDPGRRAGLGANARRFVEEHHRWGTCLRGFTELIEAAGRTAAEATGV